MHEHTRLLGARRFIRSEKLFGEKMDIIHKISLILILAIPCPTAQGMERRLIWERDIRNIYICSDLSAFNSHALRDFYSAVLNKGEEMHFSDGWSGIQNPGKSLIISSSVSKFSEKVRKCLRNIPLFPSDWFSKIDLQAKSFDNLPEFLPRNSRLGPLTSPLVTWQFRRDGEVFLSSLIYKSEDYFDIEEFIEGSIQFDSMAKRGAGNE